MRVALKTKCIFLKQSKLSKTSKHTWPQINPAGKITAKPVPNWLTTIACVAVLAVAIVMSLKSLTEPDTWWQLRTGEWIMQHGQVPTKDIFSYTMKGATWINVKWLSEVILYFFQVIGGPEFVLMLQAIVIVLILVVLKKVYNALYTGVYEKTPVSISPVLIFVVLLTLICISFRLNGRPEMFSHLFTVIYILILLKNRLNRSNLIYTIIPLQILWTNLHEGYGIGIVILIIFNVASFAEFSFLNYFLKKELRFDWRLALITLSSILAMAVHPYGFSMITHPIEIYRQLNVNKYTTELVSFSDSHYWTFQAYLNVILFSISILCLFINYNKGRESRFLQFTKYFGWGYPALLVAFFVLSLTANRNIPFSVIICCPILSLGIDNIIGVYRSRKQLYLITITCSVLLYITVVSNKFYSLTNSHSTYGLQVDALYNPSGAANFIKENNIAGCCFSDYLTSSYLLWKLRPDFKTFIDLRDLDVFPVSFFDRFANIVNNSSAFEKADSQYHFDYILLYRSQFQPLHNYLLHSKNYELVFADPVAAVYVKQEERFKSLTEKFGFKNGAVDVFSSIQSNKPGMLSTVTSTLFNPFFSPRDYSDVDFNLEAAKFYFNCNYTNLAYTRIQLALQKNADDAEVQDLLGNILLSTLQQTKNSHTQEALTVAENAFHKANDIDIKDEQALKGLGECASLKGNTDEAISYYKKCLAINPRNIDCLEDLADLYEDLSNSDVTNKNQWLNDRLDCMKKINDIDPDNPFIIVELGYAFYKINDCSSAMNYINKVRSFNKFPGNYKADLEEVLNNCNTNTK